jgi:DNA-binding XRE family transcriptional regulator
LTSLTAITRRDVVKKKASKVQVKKGRGGRKRGIWTLSKEDFRAWRERHQMTRASVGKLLGVSATTIQNWEKGIAIPLPKHQHAIAAAMKADKPQTLPSDTDPLEVASMQLGLALGRFLGVVAARMMPRRQ